MKRLGPYGLVAILLLAATQVGCGNSAKQKLIGKWELDTSALADDAGQDKGALAGMGSEMVKGLASMMKVQVEFKSDGAMVFTSAMFGQTKSETGKWEFVKADKDTVTISVESAKGKRGDGTIRFVDNDTIELMPLVGSPIQQSAKFKRVKDA